MIDHDINKLLAEVVGMGVIEHAYEDNFVVWKTYCEGEKGCEWDPLHDHNQMALVKAGLRCNYTISVDITPGVEFTKVLLFAGPHIHTGWDEGTDELRAFAKAVVAMKEEHHG